MTRYLKRPLHVFGMIGSLVAFIGVIIGCYLAVLWFTKGGIGFRPDIIRFDGDLGRTVFLYWIIGRVSNWTYVTS